MGGLIPFWLLRLLLLDSLHPGYFGDMARSCARSRDMQRMLVIELHENLSLLLNYERVKTHDSDHTSNTLYFLRLLKGLIAL